MGFVFRALGVRHASVYSHWRKSVQGQLELPLSRERTQTLLCACVAASGLCAFAALAHTPLGARRRRAPARCEGKETSLLSWGNGLQGQLGHGDYANQPLPKKIAELEGETVISLSCGQAHSACVTADGRVWTWGRTEDNRLGHGDDVGELNFQAVPTPVDALSAAGVKAKSVACGEAHTLVVTESGEVFSFGRDDRVRQFLRLSLRRKRGKKSHLVYLCVRLSVCCPFLFVV